MNIEHLNNYYCLLNEVERGTWIKKDNIYIYFFKASDKVIIRDNDIYHYIYFPLVLSGEDLILLVPASVIPSALYEVHSEELYLIGNAVKFHICSLGRMHIFNITFNYYNKYIKDLTNAEKI